eukprot:jgi/Galph1/825/GphlegSOOS_G5475.1
MACWRYIFHTKSVLPCELLSLSIRKPYLLSKDVPLKVVYNTQNYVPGLEKKTSSSCSDRKLPSYPIREPKLQPRGRKLPVRMLRFDSLCLDENLSETKTSTGDQKEHETESKGVSAGTENHGGRTVGNILKIKGERFYRIKTSDLVYDAVKKMVDNNVGSLVVIDAEEDGSAKPLGIVTERDYLRKIVILGRSSKTTFVKDIMTVANQLVSVNPSASLHECMEIMTEKRIRHIPVIDNSGNVKGMVSIGDIVKELVEEHRAEAQKLNEYIQGTY